MIEGMRKREINKESIKTKLFSPTFQVRGMKHAVEMPSTLSGRGILTWTCSEQCQILVINARCVTAIAGGDISCGFQRLIGNVRKKEGILYSECVCSRTAKSDIALVSYWTWAQWMPSQMLFGMEFYIQRKFGGPWSTYITCLHVYFLLSIYEYFLNTQTYFRSPATFVSSVPHFLTPVLYCGVFAQSQDYGTSSDSRC
jgi:hypothetical protein